jgi:GDP-fucose transporter C1
MRVALVVLFHSSCAIWSTILSKSALNGVEAPVTLLALQTTIQVVLLTIIGVATGWVKLNRPLNVSDSSMSLRLKPVD